LVGDRADLGNLLFAEFAARLKAPQGPGS
jgi:hypothetical protein